MITNACYLTQTNPVPSENNTLTIKKIEVNKFIEACQWNAGGRLNDGAIQFEKWRYPHVYRIETHTWNVFFLVNENAAGILFFL